MVVSGGVGGGGGDGDGDGGGSALHSLQVTLDPLLTGLPYHHDVISLTVSPDDVLTATLLPSACVVAEPPPVLSIRADITALFCWYEELCAK